LLARARRYLAIRLRPAQDDLLGGAEIKHFGVVANRQDPESGDGLDIIRRRRGEAGTIARARRVDGRTAGWAPPSRKFGANAAWLRLNAPLQNPLSACERVALPQELREAGPKRLRFLFISSVGKAVRHAREPLLRFADGLSRALADLPRAIFGAPRPALTGV